MTFEVRDLLGWKCTIPPHPSPLPEGEGATRPEPQAERFDKKQGSLSGSLSHGYGVVMRTGISGPQPADPIPDLIDWSPPSSLPQTLSGE